MLCHMNNTFQNIIFQISVNVPLNNESYLSLKPPEKLKLLVNQFNNASPVDNNDPENVVQSKYYNIDELQNMKMPSKDK